MNWASRALGVLVLAFAAVAAMGPAALAQAAGASIGPDAMAARERTNLPPRVTQARRFLAQRGWTQRNALTRRGGPFRGERGVIEASGIGAQSQTSATATWQPLGPRAVLTPEFGLVTGRISALALDPSDSTGNRLYVGTTGGGVWVAQNAGTSNASSIVFTPLTDTVGALSGAADASISIGALAVQPGTTGVILAGTGDPNDALDSYYGAGILRSTDGGNTWKLIVTTVDLEQGLSGQNYSFAGEGFAGFAWSSANPQVVVAAVSQAYEGTLVNAERPGVSFAGLYYSPDSGATWHLATIKDLNGMDVQGPLDAHAAVGGNAATSVVWNPVRQLFIAAVRYHGYYQSADGTTWTRMTAQPGTGLTTLFCPTNSGAAGSIACPIFRGVLAVNPLTGDTFAWTVDINNQDQGLWQDQCAVSGGACGNQKVTFAKQWMTAALQTNTAEGAATIGNGDYNLALAAVSTGQDTLLVAGANDLWKCSLAMGCSWRNTTNVATCMSAKVGPYQHALEWNPANPLEIFVGNDSGLWRSTDAIGETGQVCAASDATHFQNLNGGLGSLAEVVSMSQAGTSPYTMMAGLGVNGTAGVKNATGPTASWPQVLNGEGGPVAIDPRNNSNWYVNNQQGVSIHLCSQASDCTPAAFGARAVVDNADVGGDGYTMPLPAPFLVDPVDPTQLLIGTCRMWRGPADGVGWSGGNAISPILDNLTASGPCNGNSLIRSMAALALAGGNEVVYVGMYGAANGSTRLPGHVLNAVFNPASSAKPVWRELTLNPVSNDSLAMNAYGFDISSIVIDNHDAGGNTVYVTVEGMPSPKASVRMAYRSTDGGAHWAQVTANLPAAPANSVAVDPQDANTVYIATDSGVYFTTQIASCANGGSTCWSAFGTGLPEAPVVELSASPATASTPFLAAATYGRGVWQTPLWTAGTGLTTAITSPVSLTFSSQVFGTASGAQAVTVKNTGSLALTTTAISMSSGDFSETDNCLNTSVAVGGNCTIQVMFTPSATGNRTGQLIIGANVNGGQMTVALSGTGAPAGTVSLTPASIDFGQVAVGATSFPLQVQAANSSVTPVPITSVTITSPFKIASNSCGTSSLAAQTSCQVQVAFAPTAAGPATGSLTFIDGAGTQAVQLSGTGAAPPTDTLDVSSLTFPGTIIGQLSAAQTVTLANAGDLVLTSISALVSPGFNTSSNCGTQLAAHASCSISVVFAPSAAGSQTGTLTVSDLLQTQSVALSGTGLLPPAFGASPASLTFAAQQVGVASSPSTVTVSNTGGAPMANVGFQITGQAASSFTTGTTTCGAILANGSSCTVQVIFNPTVAGGSAAALVVTSSTLGVAAATVTLNGSGTALTALNVSPAQLTFPVVITGMSSATQTVTITNSGNFAATSLVLSAPAPFSLTQNTCTSILAAGENCSVGVVFSPTAVGPVTGTMTVTSALVSTPANVLLSGTGGVTAAIQVAPGSINFATVGVGLTSSPTTVTVTNSGTVNGLSNLALAVPAGFQLVNNTCTATLAPQSSCTAGVTFAPTSAGMQAGNLSVTSSTVSGAATASLSGAGFDFTVAAFGSSSQTIASGQVANYAMVITPLWVSQAQSSPGGTFTFQCGTLPANALCLFNPTSETVGAGVIGNVTLQISTGKSGAAALSPGPGGWRVLPLTCGLLLLPLAWRRRRNVLMLAVLLAVFAGGVSSCTSSGGGTGGGSNGSGGGAGSTPAGTYTIPVTAVSTGVQHSFNVTLTVN